MPSCFALGCTSGYQNANVGTRHFFSAPKDPEKLALWRKNVPRNDKNLTSYNCYLCDLHFEKKFLIKEDKFIINGKEVKIARERWKLHPEGYPTIWPKDNWPKIKNYLAKYVTCRQREAHTSRKEPDDRSVPGRSKSENIVEVEEKNLDEDAEEETKGDLSNEKVKGSRKRKKSLKNESKVGLEPKKKVTKQQKKVETVITDQPFTWKILVNNRSKLVLPGENWNMSLFEHQLVVSHAVICNGYSEIDMQLIIDKTLNATTFARLTDGDAGLLRRLGLEKKVLSVSDLSRLIQSESKRISKMRYLRALRKTKKKLKVHFESSEFEQHRRDGKRRLKPNAIPTLFPNRPPIRFIRSPNRGNFPPPEKAGPAFALEHDHHYTVKGLKDEPYEEEVVTTPECENLEKTDLADLNPAAFLVPITFHPYEPQDLLKSVHARHPTPILPYPTIQLNLPNNPPPPLPTSNPEGLSQENVQKPIFSRTLSPYIVLRRKLDVARKKIRKLELERKNLTQNLNRFLNEDQVDSLTKRSSRGSKWSLKTLQSGIELYLSCGSKGYKMLLDKGYPLPSRRTLRSRLEVVEVDPEELRLIRTHFGELQEEEEDPQVDKRSSPSNETECSTSL